MIRDILTDNTFSSPEEAITRSVIAANQAILNRAASNPNLDGMGSTCIILIIKEGRVYYGSVGDSRIYYIHGGNIVQVTRDQSYVQSLVDSGEITPEEAQYHQDKNQITNALGIEAMTPPVLSPGPISPKAGGIFLLCSDGLSNMLSPREILSIVSQNNMSLAQRAETLIAKANEAGGNDNITVQLVEFSESAGIASGDSSNKNVAKEIKKNRRMATLLGILTLIILIGGGIAWYYTDLKSDEPVVTGTNPPTTTTATPRTPKKETTTVVKKVVYEEEIVEVPAKKKEKKVERKKSDKNLSKEALKEISKQNTGNKPEEPKQPVGETVDQMRTTSNVSGKE